MLLLLLRLCGLGVLLSFALVAQLVVDVGVQPGYFVIIDQDGDFALPVAQLLSLLLHFFAGAQGLHQSFVLDQDVGSLGGELVSLDFQIADMAIP